nr:hypothetical protein [Maliibacterium massiliense]
MTQRSCFDKETKQYFDNLPTFVQESIMQSDIDITSLPQLQSFARNLLEGNGDCCGDL